MALRLLNTDALGLRLTQLKTDIQDFYAILRIQSRVSRSVSVTRRVPQSVESRIEEGMGLQLFASEGRTIFVSIDAVGEAELETLLQEGLALLHAHPRVEGALPMNLLEQPPLRESRFMKGENVVGDLTANEQLALLLGAHEQFYTLEDEHTRSMASVFAAVDDEWRTFRSDGTDVHYNTWRTSLHHRVTLSLNGHTATMRETESSHDAQMLRDRTWMSRLMRRIARKMKMGLGTLQGEPLKAGHYNIILDAGMAKGLAHEAFGHACESDRVIEGSALTRDRRYLVGEKVAAPGVSIVDFPMDGDWADQPFSSNGFVRKTVDIVKDGILTSALADIFSGPPMGITPTGSERLERFDHIPLPRMSNTRLEVADAVPWEREYGLVEAEELYDFLLERRLVDASETWLFLEGYRGGQVNSVTGDYVFNCSAIHRLEKGRVTTHPPAVFSGQVLETLASLRAAVGPLELQRMGMCGKDGQSVPSSGGGHLFTLFNACNGVTIGGN